MRAPTLGRRLYSTFMFVVVSVLGGLLTAGLFVPAAGIAAESGKAVAQAMNNLPEELKVGPPAEGSKVVMADGETVLTTFYDQYRKVVTLDQVAPIMQKAQVGIEDHRFYEHGPLDLAGTLRALVRNTSGNAQGGSTLTQQYVKLALLYDAAARNDVEAVEAANNRTVSRKVLELRYAIALEKQLSKDQILERYLNISYFGDGAYGIEAAAQHYFNIPAKELSLPQAAMMAGIIRNPVTTNPVANLPAAMERMRNVLDRLVELDIVTKAEAEEAKKFTFDRDKVKKIDPRGCSTSPYPVLCNYVTQVLTKQTSSLGDSAKSRLHTLNQAGLTIVTEIDPKFQDAAQKAVSDFVAPTDPVNATLNMIQPGTGVIKAMAQSKWMVGQDKGKGETYQNFSVSNDLQGIGGFEGGSTFKAYTLTAALIAGMDPVNMTIYSPSVKVYPRGTDFTGCSPGRSTAVLGSPDGYKVTTAESGDWNMYQGAAKSSNTFFVELERQVGVCNVVKAAEALGLKRADGANLITGIRPDGKLITSINALDFVDGDKPTFTVGNTYSTPLSMTNTYATLAARGVRCDPIILRGISDTKGRTYAVPSANCTQAIAPEVADRVNDILHGPFSAGNTAELAIIPGMLVSGKTGTQDSAPTILTNGYTPDLAAQAILSADQKDPRVIATRPNAKTLAPLAGLRVHGDNIKLSVGTGRNTFDTVSSKTGYALTGRSGREAGGSIWKPAMLEVLPLLPGTKFVTPPDSPYAGATSNAEIYYSGGSRGDSQPAPQTQQPRVRPAGTPSPQSPQPVEPPQSQPATPVQPTPVQPSPTKPGRR